MTKKTQEAAQELAQEILNALKQKESEIIAAVDFGDYTNICVACGRWIGIGLACDNCDPEE